MTNKAYSKSTVVVIHLYYSAAILESVGNKGAETRGVMLQ